MTALLIVACVVGYLLIGLGVAVAEMRALGRNVLPVNTLLIVWPLSAICLVFLCEGPLDRLVDRLAGKGRK